MTPGTVIASRFEIERIAGAGGMGAVYLAKDLTTGASVALKLLFGSRAAELERFAREARLLSELSHPGIVEHVAHGTTPDGRAYLAMEWLEGEDLSERLARSGLTAGESVAVVARAADALASAHARGIIHRDIKPSNVFLVHGTGGVVSKVKVLDFGIARLRNASRGATNTGTLMGTPGYMAPEQARGAPDIDARVDVFALGCVLYECLTGRPAFAGDHAMAILAKILVDDPPRLGEAGRAAPPLLEDLVFRMLSKDPDARPKDGHAVSEAIAALGPLDEIQRAPTSASPTSLTGREKRLVSVVLGSAADQSVAATLTPEQARGQRDDLLPIVLPFGAELECLADGSVLATITGAGSATDQAAKAARCALALKARLPSLPLALTTGRGVLASRFPVGEVIDRAARLLSPRMDAGPIRLDEVTAHLLDARFEVREDERGFALVGAASSPDAGRTLLGRVTPCVGRERELGALRSIVDEAFTESVARVVLVTAPAGVGKTRLRSELMGRLADLPAFLLWIARGDSMSAGSPFGMLAQALRRDSGILDGEPAEAQREKLALRVARHVAKEDAARVTEFLGEIVGVPFPGDDRVQLRAARQDARLMGDQMRRAFEDFVAAECAAQPVLIVLEDLQWGDLPTVKAIDSALRNLSARPLAVLAFARPDVMGVFPALWEDRQVQSIRLPSLTKKASERLVAEVLGGRAAPEVVARIVELSAGNAFYLEELIRAVAEGGGGALPESVLAMAQARLEALDTEARRVLRAASIFGQTFWRGGVLALLGGAQQTGVLDDWLSYLTERELVIRAPSAKFDAEEELSFRHALLRDAAYAMLTDHDKRLGHKLAAEWLERMGESDSTMLAEHFERGGEQARAVSLYARAAAEALEGDDLAAAIARALRGVACGAEGQALGALKVILAEAHRWLGDFGEAEARGIEALSLLAPSTDLYYRAVAEVALASGRLGKADTLVQTITELGDPGATGEESVGAYVFAAAHAAAQLLFLGRYDAVHAILARVDAATSRHAWQGAAFEGWVHDARATFAMLSGDKATCLREMEAAAESFERTGDLRNSCVQRGYVGYGYLELGLYGEAERALVAALGMAERLALHHAAASARHNLGLALARLGRLDDARATEEAAARAFAQQGDRRLEGAARYYLAKILLLGGDLGGAEQEARAGIEALAPFAPSRALGLSTLAEVLLAAGRTADARLASAEAMKTLSELGTVEEGETRVRLTWAEVLDASGNRDEARAAAAEAERRLLLVAAKITEPAWRESFLTNVPENARVRALASAWGA